jgi:hypothetical protein
MFKTIGKIVVAKLVLDLSVQLGERVLATYDPVKHREYVALMLTRFDQHVAQFTRRNEALIKRNETSQS